MSTMLKMTLALSVIGLSLSACSKPSPEEQKKQEEKLAAALASALATPSGAASTTGAVTGGAAAGGISATCNNKGDSVCVETLGAAGLGAESSCTVLGGVYATGSTPCPRENLVGTCTQVDASSGLNDIRYLYKDRGSAADLKSSCETIMNGVWAPAPKGAAAAAPKGAAPPAKAPAPAPKAKK